MDQIPDLIRVDDEYLRVLNVYTFCFLVFDKDNFYPIKEMLTYFDHPKRKKDNNIFIDGQLADVKTLQKMDNSKVRVINIDPISNFPELAIKYNLHKERIVQVFTK